MVVLIVGGIGVTYALTSGGSSPAASPATITAASESVSSSALTTTSTSTTSTTTSTSTTTTSTTSTTTTTTTTLPGQATQPIAPPQDPRAAEDLGQLGRIAIPKIGIDAPLFEGIRLTTLDRGPGHWPGSAAPGQVGNVVVAGHRTSHNADFRHTDQLVPGDIVTFTTADGVFDYAVTGTEIVSPDALWIIDPTDTATATLFACHPPGSTRQRIVVHLQLI